MGLSPETFWALPRAPNHYRHPRPDGAWIHARIEEVRRDGYSFVVPRRYRIRARFSNATARRGSGGVGVRLRFRPLSGSLGVDSVDDYADLGPELTPSAVRGLGKVLRILRAARIVTPPEPLDLVGHETAAADLLARAVGTSLRLELRPRVRRRVRIWTDRGVEILDDVLEVRELEDAYLVHRRHARFPVRFDRASVIRHQTETEHWHEVLEIERV